MATPQDVAAKWAERTKNASKAYTDGVNAVSVSPTEIAAQKIDKYLEGIRRAAESGKTQDALRSVTLADWKAKTATKGAQRLASGVTEAQPRMTQVMTVLLPQLQSVSAQIKSMPDSTPEDRRSRMNAAFDLLSAIRVTRR